jgi:hypothetical protein
MMLMITTMMIVSRDLPTVTFIFFYFLSQRRENQPRATAWERKFSAQDKVLSTAIWIGAVRVESFVVESSAPGR